MSLTDEQIEKIVELTSRRTAELVLKKLTDGFPFSVPQPELISERVLKKLEEKETIDALAEKVSALIKQEREAHVAEAPEASGHGGGEVKVEMEMCADTASESADETPTGKGG